MTYQPADLARTTRAPSFTLVLAFRFVAWLSGLGLALVLGCALGIIETDLPIQYLKLPAAAFLCGLALAGLGLLWAFITQLSLERQWVDVRRKKTHWLPLFCTVLSYCLSMLAFAVGCWFL